MPGAAPQPPAPPPPPPPKVFDVATFTAAVDLLRNDKLRGFRVDIETQSTIAADEAQERADASQMLQAVGAMMQSSLPMLQSMPALTPLVGKMMLFLLRRFGVGVELENSFEDAIAKLEGNPAGAMQNPKMGEAQMKQQMMQASLAIKQQDAQLKAQVAQQNMQQDAAEHQMALQGKQIELQGDQLKAAAEIRKAQLDEQMAQQQHARDAQLATLEHQQALVRAMMPAPQPAPMQGGVPLAPQKLPFGAGYLTEHAR